MRIVRSSWNHFIIAKRERFWQRAFLSLAISVMAAVAFLPLMFATVVAIYSICGDQSSQYCGPKPWIVYIPGDVLLSLTVIAALVAVTFLIRAVVLFAFAVGSKQGRRPERRVTQ